MIVIFRTWPDGDVLALFPEVAMDNRGNCVCYADVGQHGAANYLFCVGRTRPATAKEYKPLLTELHKIGYRGLQIRRRWIRPRSTGRGK